MSLRMRLFEDTPQRTENVWTDLENIITPSGKWDSIFELQFPDRSVHTQSRHSLFGGKRPADDTVVEESPMTKRIRQDLDCLDLLNSKPENTTEIKTVVERLVTEQHLIADGSRDHILPTIPGKHSDLKSISPETMSDVMNGEYDAEFSRVSIVDCRYPYEYGGGHIQGAVNLYTKDEVHSLLKQPVTTDKPHILIFHCEFSSERGPKMNRFLRNEDRQLNKDSYPKLNYPEVYLLHGGYKEFYSFKKEQCKPVAYKPMLHSDHCADLNTIYSPEQCQPVAYKPMLHSDHGEDLRHFRRKSKSWTAGETESKSRRQASRRPRFSLEF